MVQQQSQFDVVESCHHLLWTMNLVHFVCWAYSRYNNKAKVDPIEGLLQEKALYIGKIVSQLIVRVPTNSKC